jgi:hypothetical protein
MCKSDPGNRLPGRIRPRSPSREVSMLDPISARLILYRCLVLALAMLTGAFGGYLFGFAGSHVAARSGEAVADLFHPVTALRAQRVRRDAIRAEVRRLVELQRGHLAATGEFAATDAIPAGPSFDIRWYADMWGRQTAIGEKRVVGWRWMASVSHNDSAYPEMCATTLGTLAPYWVEGILISRPGQIRCSWDLSTMINRWLGL